MVSGLRRTTRVEQARGVSEQDSSGIKAEYMKLLYLKMVMEADRKLTF